MSALAKIAIAASLYTQARDMPASADRAALTDEADGWMRSAGIHIQKWKRR